jgi:DNA-binding response OmpR family regulator
MLVVDDERKIVDIVRAYLEREGYAVVTAADGQEALRAFRRERPALVVLDLMLPRVSGWDVCRAIRAESDVPIILLTARDDVTDKVLGLELGADDYVTKPFEPRELVARVRAHLRRANGSGAGRAEPAIHWGDVVVDRERREVRRGGEPIALTRSEFDIVALLAGSPGRVYTRLQLLEASQGDAYEGYERTIDSHVKNLRQKLEPDPRKPRYVLTVFGVGYKAAASPDAVAGGG